MPTEGKLYYCNTCNTGYFEDYEAASCEKVCGLFTLMGYKVQALLIHERNRVIAELAEVIESFRASNRLTVVPVNIQASPHCNDIIIFWPGGEIPDHEKIYWRLLQRMINKSTEQYGNINSELSVYEAMAICGTFKSVFLSINPAGSQSLPDVAETSGLPVSDASIPLPEISP